MAALLLVKGGQIVQGLRDVGMIAPERLLADRQRALEQRLGIGITLLPLIERGEIVQRGSDLRQMEPEIDSAA